MLGLDGFAQEMEPSTLSRSATAKSSKEGAGLYSKLRFANPQIQRHG